MATINPKHLEESLSAYLDDELTDAERAQIERILETDAAARRSLDALRETARWVASLPRHAAPPSIADDLQIRLERDALLDGLNEKRIRSSRGRSAAWIALAAAIGLISVTGVWIYRDPSALWSRDKESVVVMAPIAEDNTFSDGAAATHPSRPGATTDATQRRSRAARKGSRTTDKTAPNESRAKQRERFAIEKGTADPTLQRQEWSDDFNPPAALPDDAIALDKKLALDSGIDTVRSHPFGNEPVRLRVRADDERQRRALLAAVAARLAGDDIPDLADAPRGTKPAPRSFYYRGIAHVNYGEGAEGQLLVRVPLRELDAVVDTLAGAARSEDDMTLVAGSLRFAGVSTTRDTLRRLGAPSTGAPSPPRPSGRAPSDARPDAQPPDPWDEVLRAVGLDGGMVDALTAPSGAPRPQKQRLQETVLVDRRPDSETKSVVGPQPPVAATRDRTVGAIQAERTESDRKLESLGHAGSARPTSSPSAAEPPSIVESRLRAAEQAGRARANDAMSVADRAEGDASGTMSPIPVAERPDGSDGTADAETYVTLVIEVVVAPTPDRSPTDPGGGARRGPAARPPVVNPHASDKPSKK